MPNAFVARNAKLLSPPVFIILLLAAVGLFYTRSLLGHGPVAVNLSLTSVALGLVATAMVFLRMLFEETLVRQTYPEYDDYARRTKRLVPFLL